MSFSYGTAISVRIITTAFATLGVVIQRKSHILNDAKPLQNQATSLKRPLWHLGFWLYVFCSLVGSVFSITSLPVLVIAPLGTFTLFFNAIFAHYLLHEDITILGLVGTLIIAAASAGIAIILHVPSPPRNSDELMQMLKRTAYIIYITFTILCVLLFVVIGFYKIKKQNNRISQSHITDTILADIENRRNVQVDINGNNIVTQEQPQPELPVETTRHKQSLSIAALFETSATALAGQALIFAKISYELLDVSLKTGVNQFKEPISQTVICVTVIFTLLQLYLFNVSLHYYTTVVIIPIGYSIGIVLAYINTLVYYDSFQNLEIWKSIVVAILVLCVVSGIYLLARKKSTNLKSR